MLGFFACYLDRSPRLVSPEIVDFLQQEQLGRIKALWPRQDSAPGASA
jgi:hypothetical protein